MHATRQQPVFAVGEIGDLCAYTVTLNGYVLNALWSNQGGDCEPAL